MGRIDIRSEGCDDPGKSAGCGKAYIFVNGVDRSRHKRGVNTVVLDSRNGKYTTNIVMTSSMWST